MDKIILNSIIATGLISLISLVGVSGLFVTKKLVSKLSMWFVAFSTGTMVGGAFLHLLPESIELATTNLNPFLILILGLSTFFWLERYLKWHHCQADEQCELHNFTYMSLAGDSLHNFIDGLVIVASFSVSQDLGIATTIAVATHELPQELGDFGLLVHGGLSRAKALFWNFMTSLLAIAGAIAGYFIINSFEGIISALLAFASGGFIYIAMADLIPELHKESQLGKTIINFSLFTFGVLIMLFLK